MRRLASLVALAALLPVMAGAPALASAGGNGRALVVEICGGGTATIPLGGKDDTPNPDKMPDCAKACHSSDKRRRLDRAQ